MIGPKEADEKFFFLSVRACMGKTTLNQRLIHANKRRRKVSLSSSATERKQSGSQGQTEVAPEAALFLTLKLPVGYCGCECLAKGITMGRLLGSRREQKVVKRAWNGDG